MGRWRLYWVEVLDEEIDRIQAGTRHAWCAHFWRDDRLFVVYYDARFSMHVMTRRPGSPPLITGLSERPDLVLAWLNKTAIASVLREFGTGQRAVSHAALDELPASKPIEHLRAILVATSTLPARDEHLARLERWVAHPGRPRRSRAPALLHRYAVWHLLRRLRQRNNNKHTTQAQVVTVQRHVRAAIALLDGLGTGSRALADARQEDLDSWLTSGQACHRREAGHFVHRARRQRLTSLEFPATRWRGPGRAIDTKTRWAQARWLLHDHTVNPADRVSGLLLLLYAQTPAAISRLTLEHVKTTGHQVHLRLGREPVAQATCRPGPRPPRPAPRPRRTRRPGHLSMAVPRRPSRPPDQRLPARRTPAPTRTPPSAEPLRRTVQPSHRTPRRHARPAARHPHQSRRRLTTRLRRRLDHLRRPLQPPQANPRRGHRTSRQSTRVKGIQTLE